MITDTYLYICRLFVDRNKVTSRVETHLKVDMCPNEKVLCVLLMPYNATTAEVRRLAENEHARIWVSPVAVFLQCQYSQRSIAQILNAFGLK